MYTADLLPIILSFNDLNYCSLIYVPTNNKKINSKTLC